jgi:hypothetical protein
MSDPRAADSGVYDLDPQQAAAAERVIRARFSGQMATHPAFDDLADQLADTLGLNGRDIRVSAAYAKKHGHGAKGGAA